jgi:hypothetical protein
VAAGDPAPAHRVRNVERAVENDVGDGVEAVGAQIFRRADEVAGGVVDKAGERSGLIPDPLHHRVDRRGVANIHAVYENSGAKLGR